MNLINPTNHELESAESAATRGMIYNLISPRGDTPFPWLNLPLGAPLSVAESRQTALSSETLLERCDP